MFKLGDRVFDIRYGWGIVIEIDTDDKYPIFVAFALKKANYTEFGCYMEGDIRSLYHYDYTPTEEIPLKSQQELLREKFSGMAMQGILSGNISQLLGDDITSDRIACLAIDCTAELIKALNEK